MLAQHIMDLTKHINFFSDNQFIPIPLLIGGAWKNDLMKRGKVNVKYIKTITAPRLWQNLTRICFFNELISGLWNYGCLHDKPRLNHDSIVSFLPALRA